MIVICGATGKIGGTTARALRALGLPVKVLVRDPAMADALVKLGSTLATADLHDQRAVIEAFRGADQLLVICPLQNAADDVLGDAQAVIDVIGAGIEAARPRRVVAISDYGAHLLEGTGITLILRRLEERLRGLPVTTVFIRSAEHMQNWLRQLPAARDKGVLPSLHHPVTRAFPTVSAFDVGRVAAEILAAPIEASRVPRVIHVEGPRRYSAADVATVFAQRLAHPVLAQATPRAEWQKALAAARLGDSYARLVIELQDAHNAGLIDVEPSGEVRRGSTKLADALGEPNA
jgi:NAD(P)H dehydrogenase (quinone)